MIRAFNSYRIAVSLYQPIEPNEVNEGHFYSRISFGLEGTVGARGAGPV